MANDVSISISAKDNYTKTLEKVRASTAAFSKDTEGLQNKLNTLNKTKAEIKVEIATAKKRLKEAEKAFREVGDASSKMNFKAAQVEVESLADSLQAVSREAKTVKKEIGGLDAQFSKTQNRIGDSDGKNTGAAIGGFLKAQVGKELGAALGGYANYYVGSAFGEEAGNMFGNVLSDAIGLGAAGAAFGGPVGAAVGSVAGVVTGTVKGITANKQKDDEYFKSAVSDQYSESVSDREARLASGTATAVARQTDKVGFTKLLGSEESADAYLAWVKQFGASTPFQYDELTSMSKTLSTYGYGPEEMKTLIGQIGDTGAALGLDPSSMNAVATYLGRMKSSGKTTLEYLYPLIERGIPVIDYLSEGLGKSKKQIYDMVSKGLIPGEKAAEMIADNMGKANAGAMETLSSMYSGIVSNIEDAEENIDAARGEGYTEARRAGLQREQAWYEENSAKMEEVNRKIGAFEAWLDNAETDAKIAARNEFLEKMGELQLPDNPEAWTTEQQAAVQKLYEEYAAIATEAKTKFYESEAGKAHIDAEKGIINNLQTSVVTEWQSYGAAISREIAKGMVAAQSHVQEAALQTYVTAMENSNFEVSYHRDNGGEIIQQTVDADGNISKRGIPESMVPEGATIHGNAYGMRYVPYDGYPAVLHQGERVLTASEARSMGGGSTVHISGNTFYVREEADIDKIADSLARKLEAASEGYVA